VNSTGNWSSLGDVLSYYKARGAEGIENLKPLDASTDTRVASFVGKLFDDEMRADWPDGTQRPYMMLVGGQLGAAQRATWRQRRVAAFVSHKLDDAQHDLVVETSSSVSGLLNAQAGLTVACDHFGYFEHAGESGRALDSAAALVWLLLGDATVKRNTELRERREQRRKAVRPIRYTAPDST
jgi:hypothetical protein